MNTTTETPDAPKVRAILSITASAGVHAKLVIANEARKAIVLDRAQAALDGRLDNDLFTIVAVDEAARPRLEYTGALVKRGAPGPEGLATLEPGASLETSVRLDRFYAFLKGTHEYVVSFSAYQQPPDGAAVWELVSNEARFVHRA